MAAPCSRSSGRADVKKIMTKGELVKKMSGRGLFINLSQMSKMLGISRDVLREKVRGLEYIENGRSKMYFVEDVAEMLVREKRT